MLFGTELLDRVESANGPARRSFQGAMEGRTLSCDGVSHGASVRRATIRTHEFSAQVFGEMCDAHCAGNQCSGGRS